MQRGGFEGKRVLDSTVQDPSESEARTPATNSRRLRFAKDGADAPFHKPLAELPRLANGPYFLPSFMSMRVWEKLLNRKLNILVRFRLWPHCHTSR